MSRNQRAEVGKETVEIAERGWYLVPDGRRIDISQEIDRCLRETTLHTPEALDRLLADTTVSLANQPTAFEVRNETTLSAARRIIERCGGQQTLCLNFASAKNAGGGFLSGSQAQEESLARSSGLYRSLLSKSRYYEINRACNTALYTDHMILSPNVPVFRDDQGNLHETPYCIGMLTAPAVNAGAVLANQPQHQQRIRPVMALRIAKVLALAASQSYEHLILGAWGCGVFRNNPSQIAELFSLALLEDERFRDRFKSIVIAVLDGTPGEQIVGPFRQHFDR
jgi:uncharacterized protein (TIGR02452 family)